MLLLFVGDQRIEPLELDFFYLQLQLCYRIAVVVVVFVVVIVIISIIVTALLLLMLYRKKLLQWTLA